MSRGELVVVVPVFNNAGTVAAVMEGVRTVCDAPVVVIDDGSTDGTGEAVWAAANACPGVVVRRHERNLGKGAALRTGFAAARELGATHAVTIDADGQHDPADLPRLVERADGRALVIGRRPRRMEGCPRRCAVGRRLSNLFVRVNGGGTLDDSQSGFRVYPLELVEEVAGFSRAERYGFETEMIVLAARAGWRVIEEPISCRYLPDGERVSHYRAWVDTGRHIRLHVRLFAERLCARWTGVGAGKERGWRRVWRMLWGSDGGGRSVSGSLAVGVFIGCSPLFGLHAPICLALGWRTRLRTLPLLVGSQVSMPPLGAVLAVVSIGVGRLLLTGRAMRLSDAPDSLKEVAALSADVVLSWLVGWVVVGGVLAAMVYVLPRAWRRVRGGKSGRADRSEAMETPPGDIRTDLPPAREGEPDGVQRGRSAAQVARGKAEEVVEAHGAQAAGGD